MKWFFWPVIFFSLSSLAEYRAYQLLISNGEAGKSKVVVSTFDQIQYREYYPVDPGDLVEYQNSWMCNGRTDKFTAICANPQSPEVGPPSVRTGL